MNMHFSHSVHRKQMRKITKNVIKFMNLHFFRETGQCEISQKGENFLNFSRNCRISVLFTKLSIFWLPVAKLIFAKIWEIRKKIFAFFAKLKTEAVNVNMFPGPTIPPDHPIILVIPDKLS